MAEQERLFDARGAAATPSSSSSVSVDKQSLVDNQVDIGTLTVQQLDGLKNQLLEEQETLKGSFKSLKAACIRFRESLGALKAITPEVSGQEILVPLTQSLYVVGSIADTEEVLVDVGTGYFVSKKREDAKDFLQRKIDLLEKNSHGVENVILAKYKNLEMVARVMDRKLKMLQAEGENKA